MLSDSSGLGSGGKSAELGDKHLNWELKQSNLIKGEQNWDV